MFILLTKQVCGIQR